jgi:hypothetical protein
MKTYTSNDNNYKINIPNLETIKTFTLTDNNKNVIFVKNIKELNKKLKEE